MPTFSDYSMTWKEQNGTYSKKAILEFGHLESFFREKPSQTHKMSASVYE